MKDIKKIDFYNPPTPQHAQVLKEKEAEEREESKPETEEIKQEEIKEEIEKIENPPKPLSWWIQTVVFWGMVTYFVVGNIITPLATGVRYTQENKENTDEITILKQWTDEQTVKDKEDRKTLLCSKVVDQTKECKDSKPLPTPTPTTKINYPTP